MIDLIGVAAAMLTITAHIQIGWRLRFSANVILDDMVLVDVNDVCETVNLQTFCRTQILHQRQINARINLLILHRVVCRIAHIFAHWIELWFDRRRCADDGLCHFLFIFINEREKYLLVEQL